jgi:protein-S-isoprenylcysteine O-methyltransferase Ste14
VKNKSHGRDYVRNPMYLAVLAPIVGQVLVLGRPVLLLYAVAVCVTVAAFVRWDEQPTLARRYGAQYDAYQRAVPARWPRAPPAPRILTR